MSRSAPKPDRVPPQDLLAESAILGAILINPATLQHAFRLITAEDFFKPSHAEIYRAIGALAARGETIDLLTVHAEIKRRGKLAALPEGVTYLSGLTDGVPKSVNIEAYSRIVVEMSRRRGLAAQLDRAQQAVLGGAEPAEIDALIGDVGEAARGLLRPRVPKALNLFGAGIEPTTPRFTVPGLIREAGLHLVWAPPSGGKTWTLLRWMFELLLWTVPADGFVHLSDHPDLRILTGFAKVLWIGTEEDTGILRSKADMVLRGLRSPLVNGTFLHLWASDSKHRVSLDDLPAILDAEGPLDAIVLDSLTGLRPKRVNGEKVRWDVDNDAANEICLTLRGLAKTHKVAIFLIHHTGRIVEKGYRGPTDWWASADIMFGLLPEHGKIKLLPEKNRDGKLLEPFYLEPGWGPDGFTLKFDGVARHKTITAAAIKVEAFVAGRGEASQAEIVKAIGRARSTVQRALGECVEGGLLVATGKKDRGSPIYAKAGEGPKDVDPE